MLPPICDVFQTNLPDLLSVVCFFLRVVCQKKMPFQLSVFCIVHFHLPHLSHRTGVNSHPYGHKLLHFYHPYGSFLPTSTSFLSTYNPSKYVQDTSRPWNILSEQFFHAAKFPCGRFCAAHHAPPPNFNLTFFRPRAEIHSFGVFSRTVSNVHPYGIVANIAEKTPYGTYFNKCSPVRASQTNHFLNTKKQSSSFKKKSY